MSYDLRPALQASHAQDTQNPRGAPLSHESQIPPPLERGWGAVGQDSANVPRAKSSISKRGLSQALKEAHGQGRL